MKECGNPTDLAILLQCGLGGGQTVAAVGQLLTGLHETGLSRGKLLLLFGNCLLVHINLLLLCRGLGVV